MANPKIPEHIGRYQIVDRLGAGGMGVLYLASDPLLQRTVAIKVLSVHSDELRERFAREARSAASLKHNHIVTIYDVGDDGGYPFLAMEYLDGETMAELIRRKAPLGIARKLQLLLQLCDGLGYAHRAGIIHRDIKPANVMITSEGVLKILDFGLARVTGDSTGAGLTQVGVLIGTPHYMSPEQIQDRPVDHRSDIFAVGLVAYELLTYKKAYSGEGPHAVLDKILHTEPQPLLELKPELDPHLATVINRAIKKSPDERYDTLSDLALELSRIRDRLIAQDATVRVDRSVREGPSPQPGGPEPRSRAAPPPNIPNFEVIAKRRSAQIAQHLSKAREYYAAEDYTAAIDQCEQAAVLDPGDSRVIEMLQQAHRAAEDRQVAEWLTEAQALMTQGLLSDADRLIDESLQLRPNSSEAQALQQRLRVRRRELERAVERERAAQSAVARARTNLAEGALEAAIRCATEALAHDPGRREAVELKALAQSALEERQRTEEHEQLAHEAVASAREKAAAEGLEGLVEALRSLRDFTPPHPVVDLAIAELEAEAIVRERRLREAEEEAQQRRREEEEARRRRREEEEARQRRREEEAARQRQQEEEEEAQRRREEEAARRHKEEEDARRAREQEEVRRQQLEAEALRRAAELQALQEQAATLKEAARTALAESRFADALAALDRARAAAPEDSEIDALIADVVRLRDDAEIAERRQRTADRHVTEARGCLERGEAALAVRLANNALELVPAHPAALQLRDRARLLLEDQRRADEQRRQANAAAGAARRLFVTGDYPGAVRLLEAFNPRLLVEPVLEELHTEWKRLEQRRAEAEESRRRHEEENARAALEARQRAEAEARAEAEKAERDRAAAAARAALEAEAAERRRVEAELRKAEAERTARDAEAQRQAQELAAQRARDEAEAQRKAKELATERARAEAEAKRLAQEAEAQRTRDEAEALRVKQREERAAAELRADNERLERRAEKQRVAQAEAIAKRAAKDAAKADAIAKAKDARKIEEDERRRALEVQERYEPALKEHAPETNAPIVADSERTAPTFDRRLIIAVAAVIAIAVIGATWWTLRPAPPPPPPDQVEAPKTEPLPIPPSTTSPTSNTAAIKLGTVRSRLDAGDLAGAAALVVSLPSSPPDPAMLDVIAQIRAAAARRAETARAEAKNAGASGSPAFRNGGLKEAEATALTQPPDIGKVVSLYKEAEAEYANAMSTTSAELDQLIRSAVAAMRKGDVQKALTDAGRALTRDPSAKPARDVLAAIRGTAQKDATTARSEAVRQGADGTSAFKEAESAREIAEKNSDPGQTREQVAGFDRSRELYLSAARDVATRRSEAQQAIGAARAALGRGDLQAAERALNDAIAKQPNVDGAASLRADIEAARRKPAPAPVSSPVTIPTAPVSVTPSPAPLPPAAPSPGAAAAAALSRERPAIAETLQAYARAHALRDADEVVKVAPYLAGPMARELASSFRNLKSFSMQIAPGEPTLSNDGTNASVRCTITRDIDIAGIGPRPRRTDTANVTLQKRDGRWFITNVENIGGGR